MIQEKEYCFSNRIYKWENYHENDCYCHERMLQLLQLSRINSIGKKILSVLWSWICPLNYTLVRHITMKETIKQKAAFPVSIGLTYLRICSCIDNDVKNARTVRVSNNSLFSWCDDVMHSVRDSCKKIYFCSYWQLCDAICQLNEKKLHVCLISNEHSWNSGNHLKYNDFELISAQALSY